MHARAFNNKADTCYLSNHVIRLPQSAMVAVPREGEPTVFFEGPIRGLPSVRQTTWVADVRAGNDIAVLCAKYLENAPDARSVALVGARPTMPHAKYGSVRKALAGREVTDQDNLVGELRRLKSLRELSRIRQAGQAVAAMLDRLAAPQAVVTEQAVDAEARLAARLRGAEDVRLLVARPAAGEYGLRFAENRPIVKGERLWIYVAAEIDRYWAEAWRTFASNGTGLMPAEAETITPMWRAMVAAIFPGAGATAPVAAARQAASAAKLKLDEQYGLGNGLGLSLDEAPMIAEGSSDRFAPGMAFSLRLLTRERGGLAWGDPMILGSNGVEVVTSN